MRPDVRALWAALAFSTGLAVAGASIALNERALRLQLERSSSTGRAQMCEETISDPNIGRVETPGCVSMTEIVARLEHDGYISPVPSIEDYFPLPTAAAPANADEYTKQAIKDVGNAIARQRALRRETDKLAKAGLLPER